MKMLVAILLASLWLPQQKSKVPLENAYQCVSPSVTYQNYNMEVHTQIEDNCKFINKDIKEYCLSICPVSYYRGSVAKITRKGHTCKSQVTCICGADYDDINSE